MIGTTTTPCTAFEGFTRIASGPLREVALAVKTALERQSAAEPVLVFDDLTSAQMEVDVRGSNADVISRLMVADTESGAGAVADGYALGSPRGPGRPRLGVVAREITLLPRHWDWLGRQPGGASVALRKLVDEAKRVNEWRDLTRAAQESAYRFMSVMAGNLQDFEEATRALFAGNAERLDETTQLWPHDVRQHALMLAARAFSVAKPV